LNTVPVIASCSVQYRLLFKLRAGEERPHFPVEFDHRQRVFIAAFLAVLVVLTVDGRADTVGIPLRLAGFKVIEQECLSRVALQLVRLLLGVTDFAR
jgi:hypothetical protein